MTSNMTLVVNDQDASLAYQPSGAWIQFSASGKEASDPLSSTAHGTNTTGANVELNFKGTSVTVWGTLYPLSSPLVLSYSIDGGQAVNISQTNTTEYLFQQVLFQSSSLTSENHTILMTYVGGADKVYLDYFTYNQTVVAVPPSSSSITAVSSLSSTPGTSGLSASTAVVTLTNSPSSQQSSEASKSSLTKTSKSSPTGAVVGGVLGALALISLTAVIVALLCARSRARSQRGSPGNAGRGLLPPKQNNTNTGPPMQETGFGHGEGAETSVPDSHLVGRSYGGGKAPRNGSHFAMDGSSTAGNPAFSPPPDGGSSSAWRTGTASHDPFHLSDGRGDPSLDNLASRPLPPFGTAQPVTDERLLRKQQYYAS